jgi:hypothetical protein
MGRNVSRAESAEPAPRPAIPGTGMNGVPAGAPNGAPAASAPASATPAGVLVGSDDAQLGGTDNAPSEDARPMPAAKLDGVTAARP